jgi:hypothetical protein
MEKEQTLQHTKKRGSGGILRINFSCWEFLFVAGLTDEVDDHDVQDDVGEDEVGESSFR